MSKLPPHVDATRAVVKPEIAALADKLRKVMTIDPKSGEAKVEDGFYVTNLPEGLTKETLKAVQEYNHTFAAAGALAVGEASIPVMKKHSGLDRVTAEVPTIGKDKFAFVFDREKQVPNRISDGAGGTKMDGTKSVYGNIGVSLEVYGTRNRGDIKKIKELLGQEAMSAFAK